MTAIEKAWEKHRRQLGNRLGDKALASIKATYMAGYYDAVKDAASAIVETSEGCYDVMREAAREDYQNKAVAKSKGGG